MGEKFDKTVHRIQNKELSRVQPFKTKPKGPCRVRDNYGAKKLEQSYRSRVGLYGFQPLCTVQPTIVASSSPSKTLHSTPSACQGVHVLQDW